MAARPATEEGEGVLVAANQGCQCHRAGELDVEIPRVTEHHDERVNADTRAIRLGIAADLGPVALRLLARRRLETHCERLVGAAGGLQRVQEAAQDLHRTGEALGHDLGLQAPPERPCACQRSVRYGL